MTQQQGQTQDQQNELQNEYPASADTGRRESRAPASGDDTQTDSWRPTEDPAIEQAGGITQTTEGEPGRSQQDTNAQNADDDVERGEGQSVGSRGL